MGDVLYFPPRWCEARGTVHIWRRPDLHFEIAHESASGDSWGHFATYDSAHEAIWAARRLSRDVLRGMCKIAVHADVSAALAVERPRGMR